MSYYDESILSLGGVYTYTLRQGRTSEVVTRKKNTWKSDSRFLGLLTLVLLVP